MTTMTKPVGSRVSLKKKTGLRGKFTHMWKQRWLYLMSLPGFAFLIIFKYVPMYGVVMAFEEFNFKLGIGASRGSAFRTSISCSPPASLPRCS